MQDLKSALKFSISNLHYPDRCVAALRSLKVFESSQFIWSVDAIDNALQTFFSRKTKGEADPPPVPLSAHSPTVMNYTHLKSL